jgi:hypothetical protein
MYIPKPDRLISTNLFAFGEKAGWEKWSPLIRVGYYFRALLEGGLVPSSATRLTMIEIAQTRGDSELLQQVVSSGNSSQLRSNEDPFNRYLMKGTVLPL